MAMVQSERWTGSDRVEAGEARRQGTGSVAPIVAAALTVVLLCAGFVGQRIYLMNLTYRLEAENARVRQLAQENEFWQLQLARARSLDRIEAIARGRLGMVPATRRDVVVIPDIRPGEEVRTASASAPAERRGDAGWLSALVEWANDRWAGRTAEAGTVAVPEEGRGR